MFTQNTQRFTKSWVWGGKCVSHVITKDILHKPNDRHMTAIFHLNIKLWPQIESWKWITILVGLARWAKFAVGHSIDDRHFTKCRFSCVIWHDLDTQNNLIWAKKLCYRPRLTLKWDLILLGFPLKCLFYILLKHCTIWSKNAYC